MKKIIGINNTLDAICIQKGLFIKNKPVKIYRLGKMDLLELCTEQCVPSIDPRNSVA